ncbi:hypothetical protein PSTG_01509 [Puccinia striiformis f. sp. tritici PST-78]|uniref:Uncharacterized protein n=1 Tax=Puccinia striiformis f. sp. tritici PST-78 TaxID=1165861 RepID=A0A0L0W1Y4_9BASI|nr:hypothetical protein PSTG_01509 [Puccinia striiformis f. sp. tritici PST-78]
MEVESESESLDSSTDSNPDHPPSQIQDKTTKKLKKIEAVKLASIYDSMKQLGYTPKKFIKAFLENTDKKYTGHRRYWGSERGWESTLAVLDAIKKVVRKKKKNRKLWDDFILSSFKQPRSSSRRNRRVELIAKQWPLSHLSKFLPSRDEEDSWELVLKAQIADVLLGYVASPAGSKVPIPTSPPAVDQLSADLPDITMLELMVASDNSAQGVGELTITANSQPTHRGRHE